MKYCEVRETIKTGDILVCAGPWTFSRLIRFFTKQDVSHIGVAVWLQFGNNERRLCIFESIEGTGVRIFPLYTYLKTVFWPKKKAKMWWLPLIDKTINGEGVMNYCLQHWGDDYVDPWQFIVILIPWFRKFHELDPMKLHCSELVTKALISQGYQVDKEPVLVTPGDVTHFSCFGRRILIERDDSCCGLKKK
jgi:hypothetical protein